MIISPRRACRTASGTLLIIFLLLACAKEPQTEESMMKAGLEFLYAKRDPNAAAAEFRKVIERNPNHYGATFQLATALDRAGKPEDARPIWQRMAALAEAVRDKDTAAVARARLGQPVAGVEASGEEAVMKSGLDLLYTKRDPNAAAAEFRKLLALNPRHYGATFQLAAALDQAGKKNEARPVWEKMLKLAETTNDKETAKIVRERLARE